MPVQHVVWPHQQRLHMRRGYLDILLAPPSSHVWLQNLPLENNKTLALLRPHALAACLGRDKQKQWRNPSDFRPSALCQRAQSVNLPPYTVAAHKGACTFWPWSYIRAYHSPESSFLPLRVHIRTDQQRAAAHDDETATSAQTASSLQHKLGQCNTQTLRQCNTSSMPHTDTASSLLHATGSVRV
jgi:hypothetical protein